MTKARVSKETCPGFRCADILALDIPTMSLRLPIVTRDTGRIAAAGTGRLGCLGCRLSRDLRKSDVDRRILHLPATDFEGSAVTGRAAESFLVELVANATRQSTNRIDPNV